MIPRNEELAQKQLLTDRMFSTIRWLLEVANQEYNEHSWELRNAIDADNFLNRTLPKEERLKKNQMEMRIWN